MKVSRVESDDRARLGMDLPENPMVVTAVVRLDGSIDEPALRDLLDERILVHERMHARVVRSGPLRRARWTEDGATAVRHLSRIELASERGSEADLAELVSDLTTRPLDPRASPWRVWLVEGAGGGAALVFRIHHVLADGLALLRLLLGFSDEGAGMRDVADEGRGRPEGGGTSFAAALARLLLRSADRPRRLSAPLSGDKRIAWSAPLDLAEVRRAAHAVGARVNDFFLGVLSGALDDLVAPERPSEISALVPVALRRDENGLGNHYVSLFVPLPVGLSSPAERVRAARDAVTAARAHAGVGLGRALVAGAALVGRPAERAAVHLFSRKASLVASNVAGPPLALHLGGRTITDVMFAAPAPGSIGLTANAFSYAGGLRVTVACDSAIASNPRELVGRVEEHAERTISALLGGAPR